MQDTAKARAIPLLKIDNDFDQRWLEFTVQVSEREEIICDAPVKSIQNYLGLKLTTQSDLVLKRLVCCLMPFI